MTHIALLRGINVGGKNKLPMEGLRAIFKAQGCASVRTYIQSGNVVFENPEATNLAERISKAITERFGYSVPVVLRTAAEFNQAAANNPFLRRGADPKALHVGFLSTAPPSEAVQALDPNRSPPDEFVVLGREIYLHCPNGVARSKLTNAWFDSKLGVVSTMRNWNTVTKLLALAG